MNTKKNYKDVFGDAHLQLGVPVEWISWNEKHGMYCEESTTPIKRHQGHNENNDSFMEKKSIDEAAFDNESGFLLVCDNVEDMLQAQVVNVLVTQCLNRFDILQNINAHSSSRSFDAFDLPYTFCKVLGSEYAPI